MEARPLTKRRQKDGTLYQRPREIERQLAEALPLARDDLIQRAEIDDQSSAGYLKEECLVYLIRAHLETGDHQLVDRLVETLLRRCATRIASRLRSLAPEDADDAYQDVVEELFIRIFDLDGDRSDYLQVRFGSGLKALTVDVYKRYRNAAKRAKRQETRQARIADGDLVGIDPVTALPDLALLPDERYELIEAMNGAIPRALAHLDEPIRSAFVMRHYWDWPVENQDPDIPTISRYFGKDPRTIRNWLVKARDELAAWREETNDGTATPERNS